jgi:hypothetical protein
MGEFREFIESNESDAKASIRKLPRSHRALVRGFSLKFHPSGTIKGDDGHIGKVEDAPKKRITVASPWFYPREFALLHEIAHLVWAKFVKGKPLEKKWLRIYKNTKGRVKQNAEECFCHAYANYYGHNQILKHDHQAWDDFIRHLPK